MDHEPIKLNKVLLFCIVNQGIASKVLKEAKSIGVSGGTTFLGTGTMRNYLLELFGANEEKKEILLMATDSDMEDTIHEILTDKFQLYRPNHGILFSCPISKIVGTRSLRIKYDENNNEEKKKVEYEAIFIIVERDLGDKIVDIATKAGARGATIIDARGSGLHEKDDLFSIAVEHEKEIVMMIVPKKQSDKIIDAVNSFIHLKQPGKGILFTLDITKTSGLYTG